MEFIFLIDEYYLSSLFENIDDNYTEIEWFVNLNKHLPFKFGFVYITNNLYDKCYAGVKNSDIFYPSNGRARDLAMRFGLTYQRFYKKYNACALKDEDYKYQHDFPAFISDNDRVALITNFDYQKEKWWNESNPLKFIMGDDSLNCIRSLAHSKKEFSDESFKSVSTELFPNIYIHWSNKIKFANFDLSPIPIKWVVESLSYLNDYAVDDYKKNPSLFMEEALKKGLHLSPESTKTRKAARLMKERNIEIENTTICCEWHFKFSKTEGGRIHFHFGYDVEDTVKKVTSGLPVVGIFAKHLPID